jgi:DNA repair photolyase
MVDVDYSYVNCKTALSLSRLPGLFYSLNPYFGCEHGCVYCYSRSVFRDRELALSWGRFAKAKSNILDVLSHEVKRKPPMVVGVSTVTDPYQPFESRLQLTRRCVEMLSRHRFPISIQTKSALVLRDLDLIKPDSFDVGITLTTMDSSLARRLEPRASLPDARANVLEELASRGVKTWIFLGPIIPYVNDREESISQIIEVASKTKSRLLFDKLNLRPWVLESIRPFMESERPGVWNRLSEMVGGKSEYWLTLSSLIRKICAHRNIPCEPAFQS